MDKGSLMAVKKFIAHVVLMDVFGQIASLNTEITEV